MATFSIQEAFSFGWKTTLKNFWFILGVVVVMLAVNIGFSILQNGMGESGLVFLMFIASIVISFIMQVGLIAIFLKLAKGEKAEFKELFTTTKPVLSFAGASIITAAAVMVGFVFFIIPGIILSIMFMFSTYLIVEKGMGPIEALKKSVEMTKGSRLKLFGFLILTVLLNFVGVIALFIGLLITIPVIAFATIYIYRALEKNAPAKASVTA